MIISFADNGWDDYLYWMQNDKKILKKNKATTKRYQNDNNGIGKPERLKRNYGGYFCRRITAEHRLVYKIVHDLILIAQCRYNY